MKMLNERAEPLAASSLVLLVLACIIPSDYGATPGAAMLLGALTAAGIAAVEALAIRVDLGLPTISCAMTVLIAFLATLEYALCKGAWEGDAGELLFGCVGEVLAMAFFVMTIRFAYGAL